MVKVSSVCFEGTVAAKNSAGYQNNKTKTKKAGMLYSAWPILSSTWGFTWIIRAVTMEAMSPITVEPPSPMKVLACLRKL